MKNLILSESLAKAYSVPVAIQPNRWHKYVWPLREFKFALRDVNLSINDGESVAIVGPNGAGKSTFIKILSGILVPTSGGIQSCGYVPWKQRMAYTRNIGLVMGQKSLLQWDLPVKESFFLFKDIYGLSTPIFQKHLARLDEIFKIKDLLHIPVRKLSLGQRMRCEVIASVIHLPRLLLLDEPTIGLDLPTKIALLDYLKELHRETGTTLLLASHHLQEVEFLCDRILVLNKGKFIYDGTPSDLKRQIPYRTVSFQKTVVRNSDQYGTLSSTYSLNHNDHLVSGSIHVDHVTHFLQGLMNCADVSDLAITEPSIEDAIRDYLR